MVYRVWDWLEERAARPPLPIDAHRLVADCPVAGCDGTLSVRFYDTATGPELAVESADGGADRCSAGCTLDQILGAVAA
jgi:hypothetical protein